MDCKSGKFRKVFIYLLVIVSGATGVRNLTMIAPAMVRSGDTAQLSCHYVLEGAALYTVQWYLGEQEFYRYAPKNIPPKLTYPVPGIIIDALHSTKNEVTLRNVSREVTGMYKCEISEDAPHFQTVTAEKPMQVADVPETAPVINVEKQRVPAGETLRANCTSGPAYPAPNITWSVNGDRLNETTMRNKTRTRILTEDKMEFTVSKLELKVFSRMFHDGRFDLHCSATINGLYNATTKLEINEDRPLIASITGDASPHSHRSAGVGRYRMTSVLSTEALIRVTIVISSSIIGLANLR